jgi:tetratricopeptide (TPR) repeat protein
LHSEAVSLLLHKNDKVKSLYKLIFLSFIITVASGCATKKKKGDENYGKIKEIYHDMASKYNGYWNAEEIMAKSIASLDEQHQSDYTQVLSIYPYVDVDNASVVSEDMDIVAKKMARLNKLHGKSDWVDDTYVMLGRAQFLKQDYETAEQTFKYFEEEFNPSSPNSRLYNKSKNKRADKEEKEKEKKKEKKLKDEKMKEAKKEKEATREDKDEARKEKREQVDKYKKQIKDLKDDLRKATKKRKDDEKKARDKARKKKQRVKKDPNKDPRSSKEIELEAKIEAKQKEYDQFLVADDEKKIAAEKAKEEEENKEEEETEEEKKEREEEEKKNRKVSLDDPKGLFKGKLAFHNGLYWLARTYIERENYFSADYILRQLLNEYPTKDEVRDLIPAAKAHMFIRQEEHDQAVPFLEQAIKLEKDKSTKARYAYILGQIHQMGGRESEATRAFAEVKKYKPDYELSFNSQLRLAKAEWMSGQSPKNSILRKLDKMLSDNKNVDFQDQIYYTIGELHKNDNEIEKAIVAYQNSIKSSVNNAKQKTESYYSIAELLYNKERYVEASAYYDSTLTVINKKDPRYPEVYDYSTSLKDIAQNIQIVEMQDSLLALGQKSPEELREILEQIVEEQKEAAQAAADSGDGGIEAAFNRRNTGGFGRNASSFFAYNETLVNTGRQIFQDKWGGRTLSDDWRRSDRLGAESLEIEEEEEEETEENNDAAIAALMRNVPTNPGKVAEVNGKREGALFTLGKLFRDELANNEKCVETLNTLLADYPTTSYEPDALFYLYLANDALGNTGLANSHKSKLLSKYPDAKFSQSISNPNYADAQEKVRGGDDSYYSDTYDFFNQGNHSEVLTRVEEAYKILENSSPLLPKFALLQSMSIGKINGKDEYIKSLQKLVAKYPGTREETRAKEILRFIRGDKNAFDARLYDELSEDFSTDDNKLHYVLVVIYDWSEKAVQDTKIKISKYNKEFHQLEKLRISDLPLNKEEGTQLVLVRKFRNKDKAMKYYNGTIKNSDKFLDQNKTGFDIFVATQKNYREIAKKKGVLEYKPFFEKHYLSEEGK